MHALVSMAPVYLPLPLLLSFSLLISFSIADRLQFSFSSFFSNDQRLDFSINSNVDHLALQITRNSGSSEISNSSGQVTYVTPLQLRHSSDNDSTSFNTSFLINMSPIMGDNTSATGGGMAFMLSSTPAIYNLPNAFGAWLGLFDRTVREPVTRIVAIEFDTFKDSFDPDANHVGIDVNGSVISILTKSLSPQVSLTDTSTYLGINTSIWIDYDGKRRVLDVYLANQGPSLLAKPANAIISGYPIDLSHYLPDQVYVGFSASMGTILEAHCVVQWNFTSSVYPKSVPLGTIIGSIVGGIAVIALVVAGILALVHRRRRRQARFLAMDHDLASLQYGPQKFAYKVLKKATNGFSNECKLGQGGFGEVYKGVIRSRDGKQKEIAVKCLSQRSKQGEKEFKAEVMSMGRMRHKNLVQLLGWSYGRQRLILVYEYLPNRSLDKWIGDKAVAEPMAWEQRYQVMKGVAAGLLYLHEEWEMVVVHRDLKPSNVMLDSDFNARIGDFGLAKLFGMEEDTAQTATIMGTPGYIAPESLSEGIISKEVDIYSLGAIAIELATGCRISATFLQSLSTLLEKSDIEKAADPQLHDGFNPTELELLVKVGLACCQLDPGARPTIREVVHALSSSGTSPAILATPSKSSFSSGYASLPRLQILDSTHVSAIALHSGR